MKALHVLRFVSLGLMGVAISAYGDDNVSTGVLDPQAGVVHYTYCGKQWSPWAPPGDTVLLDVQFDHADDSIYGPIEEDLRVVLVAGGRIVHLYNVPMARVLVPMARVANLPIRCAEVVTDSTPYIVSLTVEYDSHFTSTDIAYLFANGARSIHAWRGSMLKGDVPDELIPVIRARPNVRSVEVEDCVCIRCFTG